MRAAAILAGTLACGVVSAHASSWWDGWSINGSNTLRIERYDIRGNPFAGPFPFDGGHQFNELGLSFSRTVDDYDRWRLQLYGVINDSAYRARDNGVVPERLSLVRENGLAMLPYRLELGDYFGYFTFRTLQRSLKGLQLELQPAEGQSLVLLSGVNQSSWRHLLRDDDFSNGVSWLMDLHGTRIGVNLLHNLRQADDVAGLARRTQRVASVTLDRAWDLAGTKLRIEGELAGMRGDHDGVLTGTGQRLSGADKRGEGVFAQASGRAATMPFDWRLRYERHDADFRPSGAIIQPDRRTLEAHAGWQAGGWMLRGRLQEFTDNLESGNPQETRTVGGNLSGMLSSAGLAGSIDAFVQETEDRAATVDRRATVVSANLSQPLGAGWFGNLSAFHQDGEDRRGSGTAKSSFMNLSATHLLTWGAWRGSVAPGIGWRRVTGTGALREVSPTLNLNVQSGAHTLNASLGRQRLTPQIADTFDVTTTNLRLDYRYQRGRHAFGLEALSYERDTAAPSSSNETWRVAAYWTVQFDRPALRMATPAASLAPVVVARRDLSALLALTPGSELETQLARLAGAGLPAPSRQGGLTQYETRLLDEIDLGQRLAIEHAQGRIDRAALIIAFEQPLTPAALSQGYERVRKALLDRLGAPAITFEEGGIGASTLNDLAAGRFIRVMEWNVAGGKLRFGIPRRLDGLVRMEVQVATGFGTPRDALWSLETAR